MYSNFLCKKISCQLYISWECPFSISRYIFRCHQSAKPEVDYILSGFLLILENLIFPRSVWTWKCLRVSLLSSLKYVLLCIVHDFLLFEIKLLRKNSFLEIFCKIFVWSAFVAKRRNIQMDYLNDFWFRLARGLIIISTVKLIVLQLNGLDSVTLLCGKSSKISLTSWDLYL